MTTILTPEQVAIIRSSQYLGEGKEELLTPSALLCDSHEVLRKQLAEAQADVERLRKRTHEIAEAADQKWRDEAKRLGTWRAEIAFVTAEIGLLEGLNSDGVIGHSWACRAVAAKYREALGEAQAATEQLRVQLAGCSVAAVGTALDRCQA